MSAEWSSDNERRAFPRVQVTAQIHVCPLSSNPDAEVTPTGFAADLVDLSLGGVRFRTRESMGELGGRVQIKIPTMGEDVAVIGTIVRIGEPGEDGTPVALEFGELDPLIEIELARLLEILMAGPGGGQRRHSRIAYRMAVRYGNPAELRAILEDISTGGLQVSLPEPLELDQKLNIVIPAQSGLDLLELEGRVAHQKMEEEGGHRIYRVGVEFTSLDVMTHSRVTKLLNVLTRHAT